MHTVNKSQISYDENNQPEFVDQRYLSTSDGFTEEEINKYLYAKTSDYIFEGEVFYDIYNNNYETSNEEIKNIVKDKMEDGHQVSIGVYPTEQNPLDIELDYETYGQYTSTISGGHAMTITAVQDEGFVVSTGGE